VLGFASRPRGPLRALAAAPSLRERLRAFGAQRVGRAGFAGHGLRRWQGRLVLRAVGASRSALAASGARTLRSRSDSGGPCCKLGDASLCKPTPPRELVKGTPPPRELVKGTRPLTNSAGDSVEGRS